MNKSIELAQSQIKARENGAVMFIFTLNNCEVLHSIDDFELKAGDKNVWIKEEFSIGVNGDIIVYKQEEFKKDTMLSVTIKNWIDASQMTKEQSRYSFKEILDVRFVRVQDIVQGSEIQKINPNLLNFKMFIYWYNNQLKERNINRTYEDNDYIFLVEVKSK